MPRVRGFGGRRLTRRKAQARSSVVDEAAADSFGLLGIADLQAVAASDFKTSIAL